MAIDPWNLIRFVDAQSSTYATVCSELLAGRKHSHWMWFIFPQLKALGFSSTAKYYGIDGIGEATAYMAHPLLAPRLEHCAKLVLASQHRTANEIFGTPDDLKLRSSMTLFSQAAPCVAVFDNVLKTFFDAEPDERTLRELAVSSQSTLVDGGMPR